MTRGGIKRLLAQSRSQSWLPLLAVVALGLVACNREKTAEAPAPRPVRTVTAKLQDTGETVVLTGHIQAEDEASMAFRIGGRMVDRFVNVGDTGQARTGTCQTGSPERGERTAFGPGEPCGGAGEH